MTAQLTAHEIGVGNEIGHEAVRRMVIDLERRPNLLDSPLAHHGHAVGERDRLFPIVRDEHRRRLRRLEDVAH